MKRHRSSFDVANIHAPHRWSITQHDRFVILETDRPGLDVMLAHVLGERVMIVPAHRDRRTGDGWTIRVLETADLDAAAALAHGQPPPVSGLAGYWRRDFESVGLGHGPAGFAVRHVAPFAGVTLFEPAVRTLTYLVPIAEEPFPPHLEHLVSHLLRMHGWDCGFVDAHAAFVRYRGKGLALSGPRQAGKTSLAMHLLARGGELLGSDMAQLRVDTSGTIEAVAIPHMCRITAPTVVDNDWLAGARDPAWDDNRDYLAGPLFSHGKYEFYDSSLDAIARRRLGVARFSLDAIVFPHFTLALDRHRAAATARGVAARRLVASVTGDRPLADWLPFDLSRRANAEARFADRLGTGDHPLAGFDLDFGREASLDWLRIDAMIDGL